MKYYGTIGFWVDDIEVRSGVTKSGIVEKPYTGDILENRQRWVNSDHQNENLTLNIRLSIIADLYLNSHLSSIKYVTYMGDKWKVTSPDVSKYPRVIMDIGEVYNGVNAEETA